MSRKKIAVVGVGKIAVDQHLPVIDKSPDFEVAATVSTRLTQHRDLPAFRTQAELFEALPKVDIVAICTPPGVRHAYVREALAAGKHVLMEKPPTPTISELDDLVAYAKKKKRVLFQTWHSRYNEAVDAARKILKREGVRSLRIDWRESVRKWHPGQDWVWEPGGFGVFDPGINALAIVTEILPFAVFVRRATLIYPANRANPIDAQVVFAGGPGNPEMTADFNWLEDNADIWTIRVETDAGHEVVLDRHGSLLRVDGHVVVDNQPEEYEQIYARFAKLLRSDKSEVDETPLRLAADIFFVGRRETGEPFNW
jgi:D-galactose 1-dehydrogenase